MRRLALSERQIDVDPHSSTTDATSHSHATLQGAQYWSRITVVP